MLALIIDKTSHFRPPTKTHRINSHDNYSDTGGVGEGPEQGWAVGPPADVHGSGDPGRDGLSALHAVRWRLAVPPAVQTLRANQRGHHHQPAHRGWEPHRWSGEEGKSVQGRAGTAGQQGL